MRPRPIAPIGLYDPAFEHDACGVAFVARLNGVPTHEAVERGLRALANLEHRGAAGADSATGDGAGILLQMPDRFIRAVVGDELPPAGHYGVGVCFLPQDDARRAELERLLEETVQAEGQRVIGWRDVPVDDRHVGSSANAYAPRMRQLLVGASPELAGRQDAFERKLYVIRRVAELAAGPDLALPSFSSRTLVYKGMLTAPQLPGYFPDLRDERMEARARARPLALLDEHVPELGARPPLSDDRAQRRDQHAARQRQLDARARVAARLAVVRRRPRKGAPGRPAGRLRHRELRQRARAARARRPVDPARDDDDDPRGLRRAGRSFRPS